MTGKRLTPEAWSLLSRMTLAALGLTLLASPACADWQYTRWGMTVDEVRAAAGGEAQPISDASRSGREFDALLIAPYTGSGLKFTSVFRFDKASKKLSGIDLELRDLRKCSDAQRSLAQNYGQPIDVDKGVGTTSYEWHDGAKGNKVLLLEISAMLCTITYTPLEISGPSGQL